MDTSSHVAPEISDHRARYGSCCKSAVIFPCVTCRFTPDFTPATFRVNAHWTDLFWIFQTDLRKENLQKITVSAMWMGFYKSHDHMAEIFLVEIDLRCGFSTIKRVLGAVSIISNSDEKMSADWLTQGKL